MSNPEPTLYDLGKPAPSDWKNAPDSDLSNDLPRRLAPNDPARFENFPHRAQEHPRLNGLPLPQDPEGYRAYTLIGYGTFIAPDVFRYYKVDRESLAAAFVPFHPAAVFSLDRLPDGREVMIPLFEQFGYSTEWPVQIGFQSLVVLSGFPDRMSAPLMRLLHGSTIPADPNKPESVPMVFKSIVSRFGDIRKIVADSMAEWEQRRQQG